MEIRDRNGYCISVGRSDMKSDGSVEIFDKNGYNIGTVSQANYTKMLLREVDRDYEHRTTAPWVDD
ncbi:MAG: hypothetical protein ACP5N1_00895 [Candidatus Woesearchaeota archaeon]